MANILYFAAHDALEYDDLLLFRSLGHQVFCLGVSGPFSRRDNEFRPNLRVLDRDAEYYNEFLKRGCHYDEENRTSAIVTREFVAQFDLTIVVYHTDFIVRNWKALSIRPVIWRTIGQGLGVLDNAMAQCRAEGLKIVRWSPTEAQQNNYIGHDAIIRAYKDPNCYQEWIGNCNDTVLTFSNAYPYRYTNEFGFFIESVKGRKFGIGGSNNEGVLGAFGKLSAADQMAMYRGSAAYCYFQSVGVPYTLNFIEAWMTGIPLLALHRSVNIPGLDFSHDEINSLIDHGTNGFVVKSVAEACCILDDIFKSPDYAAGISGRSRARAIEVFGIAAISSQWEAFISSLI